MKKELIVQRTIVGICYTIRQTPFKLSQYAISFVQHFWGVSKLMK